jgi:acetate kinase
MKILVLNAGSGSQRVVLYDLGATLPATAPLPLWAAYADWNERPGKVMVHRTSSGATTNQEFNDTSRELVLTSLVQGLWERPQAVLQGSHEIDLVAHRVVHGGPHYRQSTLITTPVKEAIAAYAKVAGEHNRNTLAGMTLMEAILPGIPQMAAFDTAFHVTLPPEVTVYPGPYTWFEQGIFRYGFHGLSHQYAAERAAQLLQRDLASLRIVTCHLGGGCSLAAILNGRSINTTMGFTPLEGLMMNNRSGSIDPGIMLYLLRYGGYTVEQLDYTLNEASGLLGVSGIGNDLRELAATNLQTEPRAHLAIAIYVHRLRESIGAMLASLGGLDALVFTGGVGEHVATIRAGAVAPFGFMGLRLDDDKNAHAIPDADVSAVDASVRTLVIQAEEEWMIARDGWRLLGGHTGPPR